MDHDTTFVDQDTIKAHGHRDVVILTSSKSTERRLNIGLICSLCIPGLLQCIRLMSLMFCPNVSHFNTQYINTVEVSTIL